jgi:putative membrane protein
MKKLLSNIVAGFLGLWVAVLYVPSVVLKIFADSSFFGFLLTTQWHIFLVLGIILGLLNYFVKPILNGITLPLRVITLGIFGVVVNMTIVWFLDIMFKEITIPLWLPLLETSLIVWVINLLLLKILGNRED